MEKKFKSLKTYKDKVEFVLAHFGKVFGHINKYGENYDFSIRPTKWEENRLLWETHFKSMKENLIEEKWKVMSHSIEKSENKIRIIDGHLKKVKEIYSTDLRDRGYGMAEREEGLDWVQWESVWVTRMRLSEMLQPYYEGAAYFELEQRLLGLKEKLKTEEMAESEDLSLLDLLNPTHRIALMSELGIIDLLIDRYPTQLLNRKSKIIGLMSIVCGYKKDTKEYRNFEAKMKKVLNGEGHTDAARWEVKSVLAYFGIELNQKEKRR